jgi:hypothetical protein
MQTLADRNAAVAAAQVSVYPYLRRVYTTVLILKLQQ